eukprot:CAMPEP_0113936338 /NCGR_PEP_ID=MMETSP1339-20121228/3272_1 /TAXON_ID=94617 /ORGANISM="Fibrocapsa japonica" /LENGTH=75 /DNA_ID=CAMNT_0000938773 /DNA_START=91 /DNA_END=318 /DNA_ORIENTATION=+ /assembly_acc=CAM_ASM_000762
MGASESKTEKSRTLAAAVPVDGEQKPEKKKQLKICCACPETRKIRDECIVTKGEENCTSLIAAHKACLRAEGFNV